jgi:hypothetical protein
MLRRSIQFVIAAVSSLLGIMRVRVRAAVTAGSQLGQTTAEYALVILGAAAVAATLVAWAAKSHALSRLFDVIVGKLVP